jgi:hypothetical protein
MWLQSLFNIKMRYIHILLILVAILLLNYLRIVLQSNHQVDRVESHMLLTIHQHVSFVKRNLKDRGKFIKYVNKT